MEKPLLRLVAEITSRTSSVKIVQNLNFESFESRGRCTHSFNRAKFSLFNYFTSIGPVWSGGADRQFEPKMTSIAMAGTCVSPRGGANPGARLDSWQRAVLISIGGLILGIIISCIRSFAAKLLRQWGYDTQWLRKRKEYRKRVINTFQHGVNKLIHMVRSEVVDIGVLVASGKELEIVDINNNMRAMLRWPDEFGTEKVA